MRTLILLIALAAGALAQPIFGGGKSAAIIGPRGTTLPASCATDGLVYALTATDGGNARGSYVCVNGTYAPMGSTGGTGDVVGPAAAVDGEAAVYDGITGKLLKRFSGTGLGLFTSGVLSVDSGLQFNGTTKSLGVFGPIVSGQTSNYLGQFLLNGITSGTITIQPANAAGTWTWTLPANDGDSGQVLTTDGSGVTSWSTGSYTLPTAAADTLGGIKIGSGLSITDGVASVGTLNQNTTGNAATATALATARAIGGVNFDGTAAIVPQTVQTVDSTDASSSIAMFDAATGNQQPKTDAGLTYNAGTGVLTATGFSGPLTGNVTGNASGSAATITGSIVEANTPLTTKGDLWVTDGSAMNRLAVGTDGQVLTSDAASTNGVKWAAAGAGDVVNTTGSGVPSAACTTGKATYVNTATGRLYACSATDTWKELLSTDGSAAGSLELSELPANGSNYRKWLMPDALTASLTFLYPDSVPTAGQTMAFSAPSSDVSTISWINPATAASGGSLTTVGAYGITLTATGTTGVTLPTSGTLLASGTGTADASVTDASTTAKGKVELAIASEVTTGSSAALAVTPDALRGSDYGKKVFLLEVFEDATALATGDGKLYIPVPAEYAGWNVVAVSAHLGSVVSSSGAVDVDIARCAAVATGVRCSGTVAALLSTTLTVDANEDGSETAATAAVIDTSNDDLPTAGHLRIDVDGAGTGTKGLIVRIVVQKP